MARTKLRSDDDNPNTERDWEVHELALVRLERLTPDDWQTILVLHERHRLGLLSLEGWRNATGAVLADRPARRRPTLPARYDVMKRGTQGG